MISMEDSKLLIKPEYELTIYQVEEFSKQLRNSLSDVSSVTIDMSDVDKIDTAGFQLLVSLKKSCEASGKSFDISCVEGSVKNFMELFGYECNIVQEALQ